jgi:hypothetical protein
MPEHRTTRLNRTINFKTVDLLRRIDDFRFNRRLKYENDALILLLEAGLKGYEADPPAAAQKTGQCES